MKWTPVKRGIAAALVAWGALSGNYFATLQREAALCQAAHDWNASKVSSLLAKGTSPNAIASCETFEGEHYTSTPLMATIGSWESLAGEHDSPTLMIAPASNDEHYKTGIVIVKMLLAAGADVNKPSPDDTTPLIVSRDPVLVRLLLQHGANPNFRPNKRADTPLLDAIFRGNLGKVKLLVQAGADVNAQNAGGLFPLDLARKCVPGYAPGEAEVAIVDVVTKAGAKTSSD